MEKKLEFHEDIYMARRYIAVGQHQNAIILYEKAIGMGFDAASQDITEFADAYNACGDNQRFFFLEGNFRTENTSRYIELAICFYRKAIEINTEHTRAMLSLGCMFIHSARINRNIDQLKDAFDILEKIISLYEQKNKTRELAVDELMLNAKAHLELSRVWSRTPLLDLSESEKCLKKAHENLAQALAVNPDDLNIKYLNSYIHFILYDYNEAMRLIEIVLEKYPSFKEAQLLKRDIGNKLSALTPFYNNQAYQNATAFPFALSGKLLDLRSPEYNTENNNQKAMIFSNPDNLQYIKPLQRKEGWTSLNVECYFKTYLSECCISFDIFEKGGREVAGVIYLHSIDLEEKQAELGRIIDSKYHRRGFGIESLYLCVDFCFSKLGLTKIKCNTLSENKATTVFYEDVCGLPAEVIVGGNSVNYYINKLDFESRLKIVLSKEIDRKAEGQKKQTILGGKTFLSERSAVQSHYDIQDSSSTDNYGSGF